MRLKLNTYFKKMAEFCWDNILIEKLHKQDFLHIAKLLKNNPEKDFNMFSILLVGEKAFESLDVQTTETCEEWLIRFSKLGGTVRILLDKAKSIKRGDISNYLGKSDVINRTKQNMNS